MDIKNYLLANNFDAWVIYDYKSSNPAFNSLIGNAYLTRKCFVIIKANEKSSIICHVVDYFAIEGRVAKNDYNIKTYKNWTDMTVILSEEFKKTDNILMDISENGLLPQCSYADYGTVCLVANYVNSIKSSADILQYITARLSESSIALHFEAAERIDEIKDAAFSYIEQKIIEQGSIGEYDVQQYILQLFDDNQLYTDGYPIVAIGQNANNPHYEPTAKKSSQIKKGDLVLIDLWAKRKTTAEAVFADITWMAYVGECPPNEMVEVFNVLNGAVNATLEFLEENLPLRPIQGYEVDDVCRNHISKYGYGEFFIHRTGHSLSLGDSDHGAGVNIDNFETHDTRELIDGIAFSVEPGIYLPSFGMRKEINVIIKNKKAIVSTKQQDKLVLLTNI